MNQSKNRVSLAGWLISFGVILTILLFFVVLPNRPTADIDVSYGVYLDRTCSYEDCEEPAIVSVDDDLDFGMDFPADAEDTISDGLPFTIDGGPKYGFSAYFCSEHSDEGTELFRKQIKKYARISDGQRAMLFVTGLGPVLLAAGIWFAFEGKRQRKRKAKADSAEIAQKGYTAEMAQKFYDYCVQAGIKDLDSDVNRRRALQLAKATKEINFDNMENIYVEMFNSVYKPLALKKAQEEQEKKKAEFDQRMFLDKQSFERQKSLAEKGPMGKRVFMLENELSAIQSQINSLDNALSAAMLAGAAITTASMEKEKDTAFLAGTATGIGGLGAGIATASRLENENREIRARNEARKQAINKSFSSDINSGYAGKGRLLSSQKAMEKKILAAKTKLFDDSHSPDRLFESMTVSKPFCSVSKETGSITVSLTVTGNKSFPIEGIKGKTFIDGTIAAAFSLNGKKEGIAYLNLPLEGVSQGETVELTGIYIPEMKNVKYNVTAEPFKLWVSEK